MATTPLTVLDLVPISSGSTAAQALRNSIDLAQTAERLGYTRYWFAEHHLNPGVAGTSPAVVLALTAAATSTIRIGSGAVQMGHRTALSTVEEFGLIDALHPGRLDHGRRADVIIGGEPQAVRPGHLRALPAAAAQDPHLHVRVLPRDDVRLDAVRRTVGPAEQGEDVVNLLAVILRLRARQLQQRLLQLETG